MTAGVPVSSRWYFLQTAARTGRESKPVGSITALVRYPNGITWRCHAASSSGQTASPAYVIAQSALAARPSAEAAGRATCEPPYGEQEEPTKAVSEQRQLPQIDRRAPAVARRTS
jgi:hypothetical protein